MMCLFGNGMRFVGALFEREEAKSRMPLKTLSILLPMHPFVWRKIVE